MLGFVSLVKGLEFVLCPKEQPSRILFYKDHSACAVKNGMEGRGKGLEVWRPIRRLL